MGTNNIPRVVVGNKRDLEADRRVLENDARLLALQWDSPYIECSAKQNSNIGKLKVSRGVNVMAMAMEMEMGDGDGRIVRCIVK